MSAGGMTPAKKAALQKVYGMSGGDTFDYGTIDQLVTQKYAQDRVKEIYTEAQQLEMAKNAGYGTTPGRFWGTNPVDDKTAINNWLNDPGVREMIRNKKIEQAKAAGLYRE